MYVCFFILRGGAIAQSALGELVSTHITFVPSSICPQIDLNPASHHILFTSSMLWDRSDECDCRSHPMGDTDRWRHHSLTCLANHHGLLGSRSAFVP